MKLGLIGLGKMGLNLALNAKDCGHEIVGFDATASAKEQAKEAGLLVADSIAQLVEQLPSPKVVWVMVPSGKITEEVVMEVAEHMSAGDIIIDGGNSNYKDSVRLAATLKEQGIYLLDCGTSGGISGARNGGCFMVGGDAKAIAVVEPLYVDIATENGYYYTGKSGSGHYLKMVHNGIEYGMMQAIGEGFEVLEACDFDYDLEAVAKVWNHGSVVRSWLMELAQDAFAQDAKLDALIGKVNASGEAQWTVEDALVLQVPTPVIALSLMMRYRSTQDDSFSGKVVAALRNGFGGHAVTKK